VGTILPFFFGSVGPTSVPACVSSAVIAHHCLTLLLTLFHFTSIVSISLTFTGYFFCYFSVALFGLFFPFLFAGWARINRMSREKSLISPKKKVVTVFLGAVAVPGCPCSPLQRARQVFAEVGAAGVPSCGQRNCTSCQTFAQKACWLHPPARRHRRASRHFGKQLLVTGAVSCTLLQFFRCGLLPHGLVGFL
jgi:hypothetical protein